MSELSIFELEEGVKSCRENNDLEGEAASLTKLGLVFQENRQLTKAASCLSKARTLVEKTGNESDRALACAYLGCVYWEMAQLKKAMLLLEEALAIQKQTQDVAGQKAVLTLLGMLHWRKCQWQEGLSIFKKVLNLQKIESSGPKNSAEEYSSLHAALERGVATLQNRVRLGREQNDDMKTLQPIFSMVPLLLFTGRKSDIEPILIEAHSLAERLRKKDILDAAPQMRNLVEEFNSSSKS